MGIFEDVKITWKGEEFTVPSNRVMGLIETIEEYVTIEDLNGGGVKRVKLSKAFCAAMNYAGNKKIDVNVVYNEFFSGDSGVEITTIMTSLLMMMIPPEHLREDEEVVKKEDEKKAPAKKKKVKG